MKDKFLKDYNKVLDNYYINRDILEAKQSDLKEQLKNDRVTNIVYSEKNNKIVEEMVAQQREAQAEAKKIIDKLVEDYKESIRPKGEDIDDSTLKLLRSGIRLSEEDLINIANGYKDNYTMRKLISNYAEDNNFKVRFKDPIEALEGVNILKDRTFSGLQGGRSSFSTIMKDPKHRNNFVKDMLEEI